MNIATRQLIESRIVRHIIRDALDLGYKISVYDGGETTVYSSTDFAEIFNATRSTDSDVLTFRRSVSPSESIQAARPIGCVELIYGNSGWDVIADCTDSPRIHEILHHAEHLAEKYESRYNS